jgi:hypothetical protein
VIGGLITATLLTLLVLPVLYVTVFARERLVATAGKPAGEVEADPLPLPG